MKKFGDTVMCGLSLGIILKGEKKRKWTYYWVVFNDCTIATSDWDDEVVTCEYLREDKLEAMKEGNEKA